MSAAEDQLRQNLANQEWRLNNLYHIRDESGADVQFRMRPAQYELYRDMHYRNLVIKSRQHGFTTFIDLYLLDTALFNPNIATAIIAHNLDDARVIFREKVQYPYEHLPDPIKQAIHPLKDRAGSGEYVFSNGSSIRVSTSLRSGTYQILHVSELGKISAKYPEKAREINTGAFEAVHGDQFIFVESTTEGREGLLYALYQDAQALQDMGRELSNHDFKLFFVPWWKDKKNRIAKMNVPIPQHMIEYFNDLEDLIHVKLDQAQRCWYTAKAKRLGDDIYREHPSTIEEAFAASVEGAYYGKIIARLRTQRRISRVPYDPILPVNTFWDLGVADSMSIWFHQRYGAENRLIDYYENEGEGLEHYMRVLQEKEYNFGNHYMPHDASVRSIQTGKSLIDFAQNMGLSPIVQAPRPKNQEEFLSQIEATRNFLRTCWIDETNCDLGIKRLENYRKEQDTVNGGFKKTPVHDMNSHGSDALRTGAVGYSSVPAPSEEMLNPEYAYDF